MQRANDFENVKACIKECLDKNPAFCKILQENSDLKGSNQNLTHTVKMESFFLNFMQV
jgi:hypothetical protein